MTVDTSQTVNQVAFDGQNEYQFIWSERSCSFQGSNTNSKLLLIRLHLRRIVQDGEVKTQLSKSDEDGLLRFIEQVETHNLLGNNDEWAGQLVLVLPTTTGYIARSNCFEQRFRSCFDKDIILDSSKFGDKVEALSETYCLDSALRNSLMMMVLSTWSDDAALQVVEDFNVEERLDFNWLLEKPPVKQTLALVHGRDNLESYLPLYESASALGIDFVVLDGAGHFLKNPENHNLCTDFIVCDLTIDDEFPQRLIHSIQSYHGTIDGICTVSDRCLVPVAQAAKSLQLPTMDSDAISRSIDKFHTRCLDSGGFQPALVQSVSDLKSKIAQGDFVPEYPLIVKPSIGWSSEHVYKVNNESELSDSVDLICNDPLAKVDRSVLVEAYLDGPELDVNFVLVHGKIVFFEIADDFPCPGDDGDMGQDFFENMNTLPSRLPKNEYTLVRDKLHQLLVDIGFKTGVFHLEARVKNSSMAFTKLPNNVVSLVRASSLSEDNCNSRTKSPDCMLIEINPRPPGFPCVLATRDTYGVNLFDCHLLACLGDQQRLQSFAQPFPAVGLIPNHALQWTQIVFFKVEQGGVCAVDDVGKHVLDRLDAPMRKLVKDYRCFFRRGQQVPWPKPGIVAFAAFFILRSQKSYQDVISAAYRLQQEFSIPLM